MARMGLGPAGFPPFRWPLMKTVTLHTGQTKRLHLRAGVSRKPDRAQLAS